MIGAKVGISLGTGEAGTVGSIVGISVGVGEGNGMPVWVVVGEVVVNRGLHDIPDRRGINMKINIGRK
jgi:hypothetical protein